MKKTLLLASVAALALSFAPSQAEVGNGCVAGPGEVEASASCTYQSTGAATNWVAATPNSWTITVVRDGVTVKLAESDSAAPPSTGTITPQNGETITVTMGPDCAGPACGSVGVVAVLETA